MTMTSLSVVTDALVASRDELVAMQLRLTTAAEDRVDADPLAADAVALCLDADLALVATLAAERPLEPADVIIARYRRRWKARFIGSAVVGPLVFIGLLLLGIVIVTLVTAFIWRP